MNIYERKSNIFSFSIDYIREKHLLVLKACQLIEVVTSESTGSVWLDDPTYNEKNVTMYVYIDVLCSLQCRHCRI